MVQFLVMEDNIVKSSDINKKDPDDDKPAKKQATPKTKKVANDRTNEELAIAPDGFKFIYYQSGSGYVTTSGYRFDSDKRINLIPVEEADHLLKFDNFRLPDVLELIEYAKEI